MGIGTVTAMRRAVFLDRDGVLNRPVFRRGVSCPPANLSELELLDGAVQACKLLRAAGFVLIVVTNQPDVSRGTVTREAVEQINNALAALLAIDDFRVCYHDDAHGCACRKPAPGLLTEAAAEWKIDLSASVMVGDRTKDIEAGRRAGCQTVLIRSAEGGIAPGSADYCTETLLQAVKWILTHGSPETAYLTGSST
jgi:D-glycero-D-manno-heptose 1,7-bisphosphate phosphatase